MAGILDFLGISDSPQGGILAPSAGPTWQSRLGTLSAGLSDAGAALSGHPADANNLESFQRLLQRQKLQQAYAAAASPTSDPAARQAAYAAIAGAGGDPTALMHLQAQTALPQLMQNLQPSQGFNDNPVAVTPAVNAAGPGVDAARASAMATNAAPAMSMQPATLAGALARTGSPELSSELAPDIIKNQMQIQAKSVRQATAQEKIAGGYDPSDPVFIDAYGNLTSEVKPKAAITQHQNELATTPLTPFQKASLARENATAAETARHNKAEEGISLNPLGLGIGGASTDQNASLTGEPYLKTLPPAVAATVKAIGDGRMAPVSGFALAKPQGMAIMAAVNHYNPNYDATTIQNRLGARKAFVTGADGKSLTAINTAVDHLSTLGELAGALNNGDIQLANRIGQGFAQQTGSAAPTNFDTAKQVVGDEIVKALVGTGGSIGDREEAKAVINKANSPQQLAGAIQTYQKLLAGKLGPLRQKYQTNTKLQDFNDMLTPSTQAILGSLPQGDSKGSVLPDPRGLPRTGGQTKTGVKFQILGQ